MKTIVNKLRFALLLGFVAISMTVLAQNNVNYEKFSVSTLMFLDEMAGKVSFDEPAPSFRAAKHRQLKEGVTPRRPIAAPDTLNGKAYISAFIHLTGDDYIAELEALGVEVMCTFDNGLLTANIPVDMIEQVAEIEGVTRINVAELLKPETDRARQASNVDDVLTLSQDAQLAGLQQIYDGKDVILAVLDNGIDFQHIAFKDKNGNSRIKGAYCYNGSSVTADWTGSGTLPTTDDTAEDHGTHTSSIAGGSSVIVSGTNITVTDNHADATYGGMAPGADLYLAGVYGLNNVYLANAFGKVVNYATAQGKPLVVSNSWSNSYGPRDANNGDEFEQLMAQYFGDNHPNRICLFAASNRAGNAPASEGGGLYVSGMSSSASPLGSLLRCSYYSNTDNSNYYNGLILDAWGRSTSNLACKIYVVDNTTGEILTSVTVTPPNYGSSTTVNGLGTYYSGTLTAYWATNNNSGKRQLRLSASGLDAVQYTYDEANNYYTTPYTLAVEVYPINGSCIVDMWAGTRGYFTSYVNTAGHNWVMGSDDVSVSDHAVINQVISVGSYVTREGYGNNEIGDISPFSGYAIASACPAGTQHPWITAPGEVIISGFNHYVSAANHGTVVVNNTNSPYGAAQGTSMATPAAAGIVALWMQAAAQCGHQLTHSEVKQIMAQTAIHDYWTDNGPNASHFGNGKINALAGIEYILNQYAVPTIYADPTSVTFEAEPGTTNTQTVTVSGLMLTDDITATLNDPSGMYSINTTNLGTGGNLVITYSPDAPGTHNATITLTSPGADPVTITINGTAAIKADATVADGTETNYNLPIYGNQYGNKQINQMIYPASMLTEIEGKKLKSMKFYSTGINFSGGAFNVSMGTTTLTAFPRTNYSRITGLTTVKTGQVAVSGGNELVITFDEPYEYNGGNLVIEFEVTSTGTNSTTYFYGINPGGYTSFNSYGTSINNNGRYGSGSRRQFLPKVTFEWEAEFIPVTAGTVSPSSLTFDDVRIGRSSTQTVTVTNTGNQSFTPVIDTTGLPSEFTVTGNGEVLPNGSIDLTVTYTPTDEGPHSGSFTVTIGDQTYTVTVTGNGMIVNSKLVSNNVMVDVYHSDLESDLGTYIFTEDEVVLDEDMSLSYNDEDGDVKVLVKRDAPITQYEVWTYTEGNTVATATRDGDGYSSGGETFNFIDDATQMWIPMDVNTDGSAVMSYYVPVTIANGVMTTGNTYGAPVREREYDPVTLNLYIGGSKSDQRLGGHWTQTLPDGTQKEYCVYTPVIFVEAPQLDFITHKPYLLRAWLVADDEVTYYNFDRIDGAIKGTTVLEMPYLLGELPVVEGMPGVNFIIGEDWDAHASPVRLQNAFGAPCENANVMIVVRAYYQRGNEGNSQSLRAGGGGYGFGQGSGSGEGIPTAVAELTGNLQVIDVKYVNTVGIQSSQPFDGLNIVVTRYSNGTIVTTKIVR